ncbi:hypothetical protein BC936DRAFT_141706 [Jimgerdemannia flammicorona]|uniref:Uncharacterized protein n=1 Tax=Jimgerdemannia flammicorona TaxID=994334 RepID=A0A433DFY3_9FUNG|nr:hypothetical protein BC936DRAFT_141706 [Jimgerdemannia flammicorona]
MFLLTNVIDLYIYLHPHILMTNRQTGNQIVYSQNRDYTLQDHFTVSVVNDSFLFLPGDSTVISQCVVNKGGFLELESCDTALAAGKLFWVNCGSKDTGGTLYGCLIQVHNSAPPSSAGVSPDTNFPNRIAIVSGNQTWNLIQGRYHVPSSSGNAIEPRHNRDYLD